MSNTLIRNPISGAVAELGVGDALVECNKPGELTAAIDEVSTIVSHIERLLDRITGSSRGEDSSPTPPSCSNLSALLIHGPVNLRGDINKAHELLNEIEQELF